MTELISHVLGQLSHYLDGQLTHSERKHVEDHLNECAECRRHCAELSRLRKMVYPRPVSLMEKIPFKTLTALLILFGLYWGAGKIRQSLDLPKTPAKATPAPATPAVAPAAKPAPPKAVQTPPPPPPPPTPVVTEVPKPAPTQLLEWQGQYSGITTPRNVTLQTREDWARVWQEHHASKPNPPTLPEIDFSQYMVVGVYTGAKPAGSPAIEIYEIKPLPDHILVRYAETPALPNTDPGTQLIQPYHLRVIPKTALPIRFEPQVSTP